MSADFTSLAWHDAELLGLLLDRGDPGNCDQIELEVRWPDGERETVVFGDCYYLEAKMNFGVIAQESIAGATVIRDSDELLRVREKWSNLGVDLGKLICFEIKTNSTGSVLRIFSIEDQVRIMSVRDGTSKVQS